MDTNIADITALGVIVLILFLGNRWATRMIQIISTHQKRQSVLLGECAKRLQSIEKTLQGQNVDET